jgi:ADP-ribose diphosphatase
MTERSEKLAPWKTIGESVALHTPWFTISKKSLHASTGKTVEYYIHDTANSVLCVCVDGDRVLIESQYRPPVDRVSTDYPAGKIEPTDQSPDDAVRRELAEETGYIPETLKQLAILDKDPSFSTGRLYIYLVRGISKAGVATPDDSESIVSDWVHKSDVERMIRSGQIACTFCVSATYLAFSELGWLTSPDVS